MNFELFVSKRIAAGASPSFSRFIIVVSVVAVALSLSVMIVTTAMVSGFQKEISEKIFGFWGHIHLTQFELAGGYEEKPVLKNDDLIGQLAALDGVKHIQSFAHKAGIIKTANDIEGIVLKGVDDDFNWHFFDKYMVSGNSFAYESEKTNSIVISNYTAKRLRLQVGDDLLIYVIQNKPPHKYRKLNITGIYKSGLLEFDKFYALVDIRHIQQLNGWDADEIGGYEVFVEDIDRLDSLNRQIYFNYIGADMNSQTIKEIFPNIFDWLTLQNMNEVVILVLMVIVAVINMISTLLILILDRTNMIGILKALGATNANVKKIFLYNATFIIGQGMVVGNVLGLAVCFAQKWFHIITLPEDSYYLSAAPVDLQVGTILLINVSTLAICVLVLILPAGLVGRISPVKAIRFN